jgi:hypothetical protein
MRQRMSEGKNKRERRNFIAFEPFTGAKRFVRQSGLEILIKAEAMGGRGTTASERPEILSWKQKLFKSGRTGQSF